MRLDRLFPRCRFFVFALFLTLAGPALAEKSTVKVLNIVAGTSLIEDIVRDLTGGSAQILTLLPGSSCPGHEDIKTKDFVFAAGADLILVHKFQEKLPQVQSMLEAIEGGTFRLAVVQAGGSWLAPENQKAATRELADLLASASNGVEKAAIAERATKRLARIDEAAGQCRNILAPVQGKPAAVSAMQAEFVAWAGLNVALQYGRAEDMSAGQLAALTDQARQAGVAGVADNLQSGAEAGLPLALELKKPHVVLSNFPGSSPDVMDWFSLLEANCRALARFADEPR